MKANKDKYIPHYSKTGELINEAESPSSRIYKAETGCTEKTELQELEEAEHQAKKNLN